MQIRLLIFYALLLNINAFNGDAQYSNDIYFSDTEISPADSNGLFFRFGNATFINNKEFFNPYQPGYTLTGYFIRPMLEYYPGPYTRLKAGVHILKYSGLDKYHQAIPVFTFHHRFSPGIHMVMGSLYGALNHDMIEPLFTFERVFTHHNESGLQFLIEQDFYKADVWLNWEKFIFTGSPFQEEFTAGFSSRIFAGDREARFRIELPLQLLATHKGGQIDASDGSVQTLVNFAGGVHISHDIEHSFFKSAGFRGYLAGFRDLSNNIRHHYDKGWGFYPNIYLKSRWLEWGAGYWAGHKFVAPRGEPIFQSVSQVDPDFTSDRRELLTSKIIYNRKLIRGIDMGVRFELYYDLPAAQLDHTGGLHIIIDERFFIKKLQKR